MYGRVTLYRAPTTVADAEEIADWLRERLDADVAVRERFLDAHRTDDGPDTDELAEQFADARVLSPSERETGNTMLGVRRYEERALDHPERAGGVLYDGLSLQRALNAAIPASERALDHLHVALLDRAIGTWGHRKSEIFEM